MRHCKPVQESIPPLYSMSCKFDKRMHRHAKRFDLFSAAKLWQIDDEDGSDNLCAEALQ